MPKVIVGTIKNDFIVTNCIDRGLYTGGEFGYRPCLVSEEVSFNAGQTIQSSTWAVLHSDDASNLDVPYRNGSVNIPLSALGSYDFKDISDEEFKNYKNVLNVLPKADTTKSGGISNTQKTLLAIGVIGVLAVILYKTKIIKLNG
jgi:hypothetical protein